MNVNSHGLPVLPVSQTPRSRTACRFNFEGNRVHAFLSIQAYQSELRTKGKVDGHSRNESSEFLRASSKLW